METKILPRFLSFMFLSLLTAPFSAPFTPQDNYLISCGSNTNMTIDNRIFVGDSGKAGLFHLSTTRSITLTNTNPSPDLSILYHTSRVFTGAMSYNFKIKKIGTHFVRIHLSPFISQNYDLTQASFSVSVNGYVILSNFGVHVTVVKEYILMVDREVLEICFTPAGKLGFGFLNAIEVFSAPGDFVVDDGAKLIGRDGSKEYANLSSRILETAHRINVGGLKLTPFNDTLWRIWVPDESFLVLKSAAKPASTTHTPNYDQGRGASREIAPDNVYMTAQQMNRDNSSTVAWFNITWDFPVGLRGIQYLVRLHFCDIVSLSRNQLYFNVYINGFIAYKDLDLSALTLPLLASPYYIDFVVDSNDLGVVRVSVGPSGLSTSSKVNAILNGVEIMKMVNQLSKHGVSKKKNTWVLVTSVVGGFVGLCLAALAILLFMKCWSKKPKRMHAESADWTLLGVYGGRPHSRTSEATVNA